MPKLDLITVAGKTASRYFTGRLSVGCYVLPNNRAVLFDSGIDDDTAKELDRTLIREGLTLSAIINTHSHADHCGGNSFFQKKYTGVKVFATAHEKPLIENPLHEPLCFCQSAAPYKELRIKHLEAKPSTVTDTIAPYKDQVIKIDDTDFRIITLPGHTPGMVGIITAENILYPGDAIFGPGTFDKHGVLFYTHLGDTFNTFRKLEALSLDGTVLYHGGYVESIKELTTQHADKLNEAITFVKDLIATQGTISHGDVLAAVMNKFAIPQNIVQLTLTETCVRAYLQHLQADNQITFAVEQGVANIRLADAGSAASAAPRRKTGSAS